MALRARWTLRIELLQTQLAVGVYGHEEAAQPVLVSVRVDGFADADPATLDHCLDYEPICDWITGPWSQSPHTPLLETRVNELMGYLFALDKRVQEVWVGLYKPLVAPQATRVGVERQSTRRQFADQLRTTGRRRPVCATIGPDIALARNEGPLPGSSTPTGSGPGQRPALGALRSAACLTR